MVTCLNEEHWMEYSPECLECDEEIKAAVKRGSVTLEEYKLWKNKKYRIGIYAGI